MTKSRLVNRILTAFDHLPAFKQVHRSLQEQREYASDSPHPLHLAGLAGGAKAFLPAALHRHTSGNIFIITAEFDNAQNLADDLAAIVGDDHVLFFPDRRINPYDFRSPSGEIIGRRLATLAGILSPDQKIIVLPVQAIMEPTIARETFVRESVHLKVEQEMDPDDLVRTMVSLGFNRVVNVEEVGDFAVRGGLIDFFSPSSEYPVRAEFFGDEIESLRQFDVRNQRTVARLDAIDLLPRREIPIRSETIENHLEKLDERDADIVRARFINEPELPGLEWLAISFGIIQGRLADYISNNDIVLFDNLSNLKEELKDRWLLGEQHCDRARERFTNPVPLEKYYTDPEASFAPFVARPHAIIEPFSSTRKTVIDFRCREHPAVGNRIDYLKDVIAEYENQGIAPTITCDNPGQAQRLGDILAERGITAPVEVFHIHAGFVSEEMKLALLTDHQIFSRKFRRIKRRRYKEGVALTSYTNLNPGDIVVHEDHGLARFKKLETIEVDQRKRDCLLLVYQGGDKLFVPIEEFNRVSKYAGKDGLPRLTTLGGPQWERLKKKTRKAIEDMAEDLLKLYAERRMRPGYAFNEDTVWQRQLEASFPYEETPDQMKAIVDVKRDMESTNPTDRLVCGDVGYGKTEVAVRAAFKAIENGKQVAVLVPTTILAQQHFSTFAGRFADFPIKVEMLSRFKTRKEQIAIVEQLAAGKVDVIIGTHRLLSKDVEFKNLGLLVVDEEQRFGVRHKEKLRQIRKNVDTITLTATPIPRTLQMSLMGARDMTLIATSPRDRLPIQTEIAEFDPEIIAEAILREIDRDGQVFFVHNRVQSIDAIYRYLRKLIPQVEIGIAHGQMHEKELEGVMLAFLARRYQVLLCTAIIESGLDIPSVNTIIINRADRFGLAQLYQLRGRVGRSPVRAYSYLLTPPYRLLTNDARKRLRAIEAHSDLGSGFALAMRDLEIRGAGNILGAQQSGFIEEIGFDLYTKLLEETVAELKGEKLKRLPDTRLEGSLEMHLPEDYVDVKQQKVDIYRRLSDARTLDMIEELRDEVTDRFGRMPKEAASLFDASGLRLAAAMTGAEKVKVGRLRITVEYPATQAVSRADIEAIRRAIDAPIEFSMMGGLVFTVDLSAKAERDRLPYMRKVLSEIAHGMEYKEVGV